MGIIVAMLLVTAGSGSIATITGFTDLAAAVSRRFAELRGKGA